VTLGQFNWSGKKKRGRSEGGKAQIEQKTTEEAERKTEIGTYFEPTGIFRFKRGDRSTDKPWVDATFKKPVRGDTRGKREGGPTQGPTLLRERAGARPTGKKGEGGCRHG